MAEELDLLIIGAGPAGLAAAVESMHGGLAKVLVVEKGPSHSQMIRTFYKEGKRVDAKYLGLDAICMGLLCLRDGNRESFLSFMDHVIEAHSISILYGTEIGSVTPAEGWSPESPRYSVKASGDREFLARFVFIAIGKMGKPKRPEYFSKIPPKLRSKKTILFDINARDMEGLDVLVVGGGDSAVEYCHMLSEKSRVTISYRQREFQRPNEINRRMITELLDGGKISACLGSNIESISDDDGRPRVHFAEDEFPDQTFDVVLYGLGGMTPLDFMKSAGLELGPSGDPVVDPETSESSKPGIYVIGDLLGKGQGGGSIISGFNSAASATRSLFSKYLGKELGPPAVSLDHKKF